MSLFIPPSVRAPDANNNSLSGARWYFYLTGTTTGTPVYTTSALTTSHGNYVTADAGGKFAPIYLNPSITYRAILVASGGDPLTSGIYDVDPYNVPLREGSVLDFGADPTGVANSTSAFAAAIAALDTIHWPGGTYKVDAVTITANKKITTDGMDTHLVQTTGQVTTRVVNITGSNVELGSLKVTGNISTDDNEQNHAVFVNASAANIDNVTIGNVHGINIRGDVVALYGAGGFTLSNVTVGHGSGANVFRHVVSVVGAVQGWTVNNISGTQIGLGHIDIEPDANSGVTRGGKVGHLKGNYVLINSPDPDDYIDGIEFDSIDIDPDGHGSTPPYETPDETPVTDLAFYGNGIYLRNCKSLAIGKFRAEDFAAQAIFQAWENNGVAADDLGEQNISIGHCELIDCCKTEAVLLSYIQGTTGVTRLNIDHLTATTTLSSHSVLSQCDGAWVGFADINLAASSYYMRTCADSVTEVANITGGIAFLSCTDSRIEGGTQAVADFFNNSTRCVGRHSTITTTGSVDNSGTSNSISKSRINGTYFKEYAADSSFVVSGPGAITSAGQIASTSPTGGVGYATGAGGAVTQGTNRTTAVEINKVCGAITLISAAGSATPASFTVTNSTVAATDTIHVVQKSGTDKYVILVTAVAAGSFQITSYTTGGTTTEQPVFNFTVMKAVAS